jgi:hypothetical protein
MAAIDLTSGSASAYGSGELQLQGKVQMTTTPTPVTDNLNVASPLLLSTTLVQVTSTLKITTNDNPYIDAEDGATNNRFTVGRDGSSQQVNVDFASNPTGSTTAVGAIRTYRDGVNLSEAMTFREDGNVGIGTNAPTELLDVSKNQASPTRVNISNTDVAGTSTLRFSNASGAASALFENATNQFTFQNAINSGVIRFQTTNAGGTTLTAATITGDQDVGIGTTAPVGRLHLYKAASATRLAIDGDAGQNRLISYRTGAVQRFGLYVNNTAESGANAGSDFAVRAYSDAGTLLTTPLFIQRSTSNVGIGTTTPSQKLQVIGTVAAQIGVDGSDATGIRIYGSGTSKRVDFTAADGSVNERISGIGTGGIGTMTFAVNNNVGVLTENMRITEAGNVGIGTTTPAQKLDVAGRIRSISGDWSLQSLRTTDFYYSNLSAEGFDAYTNTNGAAPIILKSGGSEIVRVSDNGYLRMAAATGGIQFNGDTAAANALDDYEEGTFTPTVIGNTTAGTATYTTQRGRYTKIGRQVSCQIDIGYNSGTGTGDLAILGLPFAETQGTNPAVTIGYLNGIGLTALNYALAYIASSSSRIDIVQLPVGGGTITTVPYDSDGRMILNVTYIA